MTYADYLIEQAGERWLRMENGPDSVLVRDLAEAFKSALAALEQIASGEGDALSIARSALKNVNPLDKDLHPC